MAECLINTSCTPECCVFDIEQYQEEYRTRVNEVIGRDNRADYYEEHRLAATLVYGLVRRDWLTKYTEKGLERAQISDSAVTVKAADDSIYEYKVEKVGPYGTIVVKANQLTGAQEVFTKVIGEEESFYRKTPSLLYFLPEVVEIASSNKGVYLIFKDREYFGKISEQGIESIDYSDTFGMTMGWTEGMLLVPAGDPEDGALKLLGIDSFGRSNWSGGPY